MIKKLTLFDKIKSENLDNKSNLFKFSRYLIGISTFLICTFFFISKSNQSSFEEKIPKIGSVWNRDQVVADLPFPILRNTLDYNIEVEKINANHSFVFIHREIELKNSISKINSFFDKLSNSNSFDESLLKEQKLKLIQIANFVYSTYLIDLELDKLDEKLLIVNFPENKRKILIRSEIFDKTKLKKYLDKQYYSLIGAEKFKEKTEREIINLFVPNVIYSRDLTEIEKTNKINSIPKTLGFINSGEVLISKNEKITDKHFLLLNSYYTAKLVLKDNKIDLLSYLGSLGHILLIFTFIFLYFRLLKNDEIRENSRFFVINFSIILIATLSWLSIGFNFSFPFEYLILLPSISMTIYYLFETKVALVFLITMSFLISGIRGNDYVISFTLMFSSFLTIYSLKSLKNKNQIYKSILATLIGFILPILFFNFETNTSLNDLISKITIASLNAAITPLFALFLLYIYEKFLGLNTNLSINDLDNLNHPLMEKLNELAPGTYQHSLGVSLLSEKCALAIGANPQICRITPYFHDIGKIEKPEYFVENQTGFENKHNLISPIQSSQIIKSHVTEGLRIASEYKLPKIILEIISNHHGTTLIKHFYAKAMELSENGDIDIEDFKYPGPKPNSKESAIIMICDQTEAISRIEGKSKEEIKSMINRIISDMLEQGQFDECPITTKELFTIKDTLHKQIMGTTHKRVDYLSIKPK